MYNHVYLDEAAASVLHDDQAGQEKYKGQVDEQGQDVEGSNPLPFHQQKAGDHGVLQQAAVLLKNFYRQYAFYYYKNFREQKIFLRAGGTHSHFGKSSGPCSFFDFRLF